jgi:hypothetical protein
MKFRFVYLLFLGAFCIVTFQSNRNGRASTVDRGNTGAPGDETIGGAARTCQSCHNSFSIQAAMTISLRDSAGTNPASSYIPGRTYTARVKIDASGTNIRGYGFQMIALYDDGNKDTQGFKDEVENNNYKLAKIDNGRTYAEHDNISDSSFFEVKWKAPLNAVGAITFYASGNAVNRNGNSGGDGASVAMLQIKQSSISTQDPSGKRGLSIQALENPVEVETQLRIRTAQSGIYHARAFDLSGKLIWETALDLPEGETFTRVPMAGWENGVYVLRLSGRNTFANLKLIKL